MTSPEASGWLRAGTVSFALHALVVLSIGVGAWLERGRMTPGLPPASDVLVLPPVPMIDLSVTEDSLPLSAIPPPEVPPPGPASDAPPSLGPAPALPRSGPEQQRAAAPDSGNGAGRPSDDVTWRRDRSTLRDRLSDGAARYQPAHSRVAARAASPQADRREPTIGLGDAPRSARAAGAPPAASLGLLDADARSRGGETEAPGAPEAVATPVIAEPGPPSPATREGPLDSAQGRLAFDVERRGPATDDRSIRAESAELHPSVTDLSAPAAPGASNEGHGPGALPGPVPERGTRVALAPSLSGHLGPSPIDVAGAARERAHARYESEIRARVKQALVFPRGLAIRLLLGETMLSFAVAPDGHVDGPILVTKSAGYQEFDRAAVEAVRHAAPFPPLPTEVAQGTKDDPKQGRAFSLRVTFSNPVIR